MVPANVMDIRPTLRFEPVQRVSVILGFDSLWRNSTTDGLYGSGLSEFVNTNKVRSAK